MDSSEMDKDYHPELVLDIKMLQGNPRGYRLSPMGSYLILLVKTQDVKLRIDQRDFTSDGPCLVCLNEKSSLVLPHRGNHEFLQFHPREFNDLFNYTVLEMLHRGEEPREYRRRDFQDFYLLGAFRSQEQPIRHILPLNPEDFRIAEELLEKLKEMLRLRKDPYWPCKSRSYLYELLFLSRRIFQVHHEEEIRVPRGRNHHKIQGVITYLQSNCSQKITIPGLCQKFSINRTTLSRDFKESCGMSIMEFLGKLRMEFALKLLEDTNLTLWDIAERTGYSDVSYFGRQFKNYYKVSPSTYRKNPHKY